MPAQKRIALILGAALIGLGIGVAATFIFDIGAGDDPQSAGGGQGDGPGGPFTLTSHTGETVSDATFHGRMMLITFGFTHCPDVCPTTLMDLHNVLDALGDDADAVQPVFVSVDPERDTPELLNSYVPTFDERIVGLTGAPEAVKELADAYGVWYEQVPNEQNPEYYLINHTAGVFLMDEDGRFLQWFGYPTRTDDVVAAVRERI